MKKSTKGLLIFSFLIIFVGVITTAVGLYIDGIPNFAIEYKNGSFQYVDFREENQETYVVQEKTKIDSFSDIQLPFFNNWDITFKPSDDDSFYMEYALYLNEESDLPLVIQNNTLANKELYNEDDSFYLMQFSFSPETLHNQPSYIIIYYPADYHFNTVSIENAGNYVTIEGLSCDTLNLRGDYISFDLKDVFCQGDAEIFASSDCSIDGLECENITFNDNYSGSISISNLLCHGTADFTGECTDYFSLQDSQINTLTVTNDYGNCTLSNNIIEGTVYLCSDSGSMEIDTMTCDSATIESNYGEVTASALSCTNTIEFNLDSANLCIDDMQADAATVFMSYGLCKIENVSANNLNINNSEGEVYVSLADKNEIYNYSLHTEWGEISLFHKTQGNIVNIDNGADRQITIECESGDIVLE